ncbi:MAG: hypothetical protein ACJ780_15935 [Solirubrobacteraceae bacterium]
MNDDKPEPTREVADYVADRAPELDPQDVSAFMAQHPKPDDEPESHVGWAVRVLRETREGEVGDGLPVDRVVREMRQRKR